MAARCRIAEAIHAATVLVASFALSAIAIAQIPRPSASAWPFSKPTGSPATSGASAPAAPLSTPPPHDVVLQEKTFAQLSDQTISELGRKALAIKPEQWKQGETENFIIHYRRQHDALEVAREIEFDLWNVAQALGANKEQYAHKSHVYVFKDEDEWKQFLAQTESPSWSHSFAHGDELFLDVHGQNGAFEPENLAHETTHVVVARLYGHRLWPLWLNEGFAEYMGRASVAARHSQSLHRNQQALHGAELSVAELTAINEYPADRNRVDQLYETSEKFVRYLGNKYPKELFPKFVERLLEGDAVPRALVSVYGSDFQDMAAFQKKFERFTR